MTVLAPEDAVFTRGRALATPGKEQPARSAIGMPPRARFEVAVQQALARIVEIVAAGTEEVSAVLWLDESDEEFPNERTETSAEAPIDFAAFARIRAADRRRRVKSAKL